MTYSVKEIFYTLQGEGKHAGRPAVFCRFSGCNLWDGLEKNRSKAICQFCDTDFVGTDGTNGGKFKSATELGAKINDLWPTDANKFIVITGGEPALQLDDALIDVLHDHGFYIAVETNGTLPLPTGIDWVCMSPKAGTTLVLTSCDELKVVYPQEGLNPSDYLDIKTDHRLISPKDNSFLPGPLTPTDNSPAAAIAYCKKDPRWNLSIQSHKYLGIE